MHSRIIKLRSQHHFNNPGLASFPARFRLIFFPSKSRLNEKENVESRTQSLLEQNVLGIVFIVYVHCIWYDLLAVLGMIRWKINCQGEGTIIRDFPFWSQNSFCWCIIVWILLSNAAKIRLQKKSNKSHGGEHNFGRWNVLHSSLRAITNVRPRQRQGNKKSFAPFWEDAIKATWAESWDERQRFSIKLINFYDPKASRRTAARIELERKLGKALVIIDNLFSAPTSRSYPVCRSLRGLLPTCRMATVDTSQKRLWHILAKRVTNFVFRGYFWRLGRLKVCRNRKSWIFLKKSSS